MNLKRNADTILLFVNLRNLRFLVAMALLAISSANCLSVSAAGDDPTTPLAAVKRFLATRYPDKTWAQGPARMENAAINRAYRDARFYYVASSQDQIDRQGMISVMMRVDRNGQVREVSGPTAMNDGLMRIGNAADARIAAAAIMSLTFGPLGPVSISAAEVPVAPNNGGWYCLATPGPSGAKTQSLFVVFDAGGHCVRVSHYSGGAF